jgi:serine/threonine-protein kinase RsbW
VRTIKFAAQVGALSQGKTFVADYAQAAGFPPSRVGAIELAVEEALTNICTYAYPGGAGDVEIRCSYDETQGLCIDIIDAGMPFDVLSMPAPELADDPDRRISGGLGIFLLRTMVDDVIYRRDTNQNILRLVVFAQRSGDCAWQAP